MCLILFAWRSHPQYKLLVAANRDEFYARPTAPAHFWNDAPHILAGRDLEQGGSWLGITRNGRFAALTNVRNPQAPLGKCSRGLLVSDFLNNSATPEQFLQSLQSSLADYSPFNVLVGDGEQLFYGNSSGHIQTLQSGVYGLSNAALDTPWPKVITGKQALSDLSACEFDTEQLFDLLNNTHQANESELPDTGISMALEKPLSSRFIHLDGYGTRSSTIVTQSHDNEICFTERQFDDGGQATDTVYYSLLSIA